MFVRRLYLRDIAQVTICAGSNIASIRPMNGGGVSVDMMIREVRNPILTPMNAKRREYKRRFIKLGRAYRPRDSEACGDFGV